jgi:hypothetical protein
VLADVHPSSLRPIGTVPRRGFETAIHARARPSPHITVAELALDSKLRPLGTSQPVVV